MERLDVLCAPLLYLPTDGLSVNGAMSLFAQCPPAAYRPIMSAFVVVLMILLLLILLYVRQRQRAYLAQLEQIASEKKRHFLAQQKETERRLTRKYIEGLESERERIATELHDDVCNSLLAFEMNMRALSDWNVASMKEHLELLKNVRERLRNISHELMPPAFQYATIDEMLEDYVQHLILPEAIKVEYHSTKEVDWEQVPQEIGFELYRIVQEAVSNAVKYAAATCVSVELSLAERCLSLLVADNGKGFDSNKKIKGMGLRTIRQRTEIIGGKMELDAVPGAGVQIKVSVRI